MEKRDVMNHVEHINALALAFIGDAVIGLDVRRHILERGTVRPNDLHRRAVLYVSAKAQARTLYHLMDEHFFNSEECAVVRKGKNAKSATIPKNTPLKVYRYSTALEAVIGYHHLMGNESRVMEIMEEMYRFLEGDTGGEKSER